MSAYALSCIASALPTELHTANGGLDSNQGHEITNNSSAHLPRVKLPEKSEGRGVENRIKASVLGH